MPENTSWSGAEYETEEAQCDEQRVECRDLQMFQALQHQVDHGARVRILGNRMSESASGFETRADVSEIDQVITRRNAGKQRHRH